jgi:iron uptake system component EfeO
MQIGRVKYFALLTGALPLLLVACGGHGASTRSAQPPFSVLVTLSDAGCAPRPSTVPAGPVTFEIDRQSAGADATVSLLLQHAGAGAGLQTLKRSAATTFTLTLAPGGYQLSCPGTQQTNWPFSVTAPLSAQLAQATQSYHDYVVSEVNQLVTATDRFATAVKAGDIAGAKSLYAPARVFYESIEPVAESFGDLDAAIDARRNDVANTDQWTGFHRLEMALWQDGSLEGMGPLADKLVADVTKLQALVTAESYQPAQLAMGATDLLNEVGARKVTGEEDAYSHTDLWDFAANVAGAKQAFTLLQPTLAAAHAELVGGITQRFATLEQSLATYRDGGGYVDYSTVTADQRKTLAQQVDALADLLSQVAPLVFNGP